MDFEFLDDEQDITRDPVELAKLAQDAVDRAQINGYIRHDLTGSAICPAVTKPKDVDVLVLVEEDYNLIQRLQGFWACEETQYSAEDDGWCAYRGGTVNLILTSRADFYAKWVQAGQMCAKLGVTDRRVRVFIHELVRDGTAPTDALVRALGQRL